MSPSSCLVSCHTTMAPPPRDEARMAPGVLSPGTLQITVPMELHPGAINPSPVIRVTRRVESAYELHATNAPPTPSPHVTNVRPRLPVVVTTTPVSDHAGSGTALHRMRFIRKSQGPASGEVQPTITLPSRPPMRCGPKP